MMPYVAVTTVGIPETAQHLIWDIFFVQANRGTDFTSHLPWHGRVETRCVSLTAVTGELLAAAVIRPAQQENVAMVGFVCVAQRSRGHGLGRALMESVNEAIDEAGYRAALLWTSHPAFYEACNYRIIGQDTFLRISGAQDASRAPTLVAEWPASGDRVGLPAFAQAAKCLCDHRAEAIVACGGRGATLVDWRGAPEDIIALMAGAEYDQWHVNLGRSDDDFNNALKARDIVIAENSGSFVMARFVESAFDLRHVPVAERI
ncbi:MAG: GNAT family N-acetyltransferase [Sphingomonas phyllosphaerae]|uniref:GNAT family N-acetyltransferase n=1 Tax=Sphingomonas phyllosphaerae TaxID=257003 RepID=UPI002FF5585A